MPRPTEILTELGHVREDERDEREERRGIETRASALIAAGAAIIGLVATAVQNLHIRGHERDVLEGGIAVAGAVMVVAIIQIVRVLNVRSTDPGAPPIHKAGEAHSESDVRRHAEVAEEIRDKNLRRLELLRVAARLFAASVALFVLTVVYAAFESSPPSEPIVNVVVHYPPAKAATSMSCTSSGGGYIARFTEHHPTETVRTFPTAPPRLTCVTPAP